MAEYHVGCGLFGTIYAGKITPPRKDGLQMWKNKSDVTDGAIEAVVNHFIIEMDRDDKNKIQKAWGVRGNRTLKVTFELVPNTRSSRMNKFGDCPVCGKKMGD